MKTYEERTKEILEKVTIKKRQRKRQITISAGVLACVIALSCYLFVPLNNNPPSMNQYKANEYYDIIAKINAATYEKPDYKNNFEYLTNAIAMGGGLKGSASGSVDMEMNGSVPEMDGAMPEGSVMEGDTPFYDGLTGGVTDSNTSNQDYGIPEGGSSAPESSAPNSTGNSYEETTDNQVAGVIEGDRIKRSNKYIYYMNGTNLRIYTIEGESSAQVGDFTIEDKDGYKLSAYEEEWEMFLSNDCSTITLLSSCYNHYGNEKMVCLVSLDVTDPAKVTETARTYLSGSYLSSRLVGDEILLISHYNITRNIDFDNPATFVPQYGTADDMKCVPGDKIVAPDELSTTQYTVICKLDEKTLKAKATAAFLSYANEVYVSQDKVYATRSYYSTDNFTSSDKYTSTEGTDSYRFYSLWTEISAMNYSGDTMEYAGSVSVEGTINNQYNLDEYEGILRVVTTTNASIYRQYANHSYQEIVSEEIIINEMTGSNASLYCIDLSTWKIVAEVERFAPRGESVQSVRFDKDTAYVCTAIVLTDPVFVFDLSDLNNITYKDTGTITGYSSSLINFGEGYLLGIGYGASFNTMKLEIYTETATGVASVCSYEVPNCAFATEYKSYYINRDKHFIGIGYETYNKIDAADFTEHYTLFLFDGYDFVKIIDEEITGINNYKRGVLIDGYFYMFGNNFAVRAL